MTWKRWLWLFPFCEMSALIQGRVLEHLQAKVVGYLLIPFMCPWNLPLVFTIPGITKHCILWPIEYSQQNLLERDESQDTWEDLFHWFLFFFFFLHVCCWHLFLSGHLYILFSISSWACWIWKVALLLLQLLHCCNPTETIQRELIKGSVRQFLWLLLLPYLHWIIFS